MSFKRSISNQLDWGLVALILAVSSLGLVVLYSADFNPDRIASGSSWLPFAIHSNAFFKQAIYLIGGFVLATACVITLTPLYLQRVSNTFLLGCLALLLCVLIFGTVANNSKSWFALGSLRFQPSELAKVALILALAKYLARNPAGPGGYTVTQLIGPALITLAPVLLILKQPDFGTAAVLLAVAGGMVLFMGVRWKILATLALAGVAGAEVGWRLLKPYQKQRIMVLFDPNVDPLGAGYHIIQSKIAVGSGGFWGKGFMHGTQTQLQYLPEHQTDFIFSVLAEEWGFVGCAVVLILYFGLLARILRVALRGSDPFSSLVAVGVAALILVHTFVNIGMVLGLVPVVGIPLPLFSYGGSSILSTMLALGLVLMLGAKRST